jgi:hypothetical protein
MVDWVVPLDIRRDELGIAVDSSVEDSWSKGALKFYNVAHEHSTRGLGFRV